ncbi:MAG TPA: effector-associated domain EAD1-containing protein, partial [Urbifossiella sp.]|nr:effector-associated domain EAD1-containing protein [Urbifossiella sp.]
SPPSFEAELAGGESESEPTPSQLSGRSTSPASMTSELMVTPPAYRFAEVNPHPPKSGRDPHLPTDDNLQRFAAEFPDAADAKLRHPDQNDGGGGLHRPSCLGRWSHVGILEQSGDSHVTGREMQALRDVLCDAFTEQSFREMLLFSWDKDLEDLSEEGTLPERVLSVIQSARREGWLDDFVRSAAEANPGNPALRAFRSTYADAQSRRGDKGAAQPSHKPEPAQPGGAAGPQVNRADRNLPSGGKTPGTEQSGRGNAVGHIFVSYSHEDADLAGTRRSGALVPAAETDLAVVLAARVPEELALMVSLKLRESPEDIAAAAREPHLTGPVLLRWAQERGRLGELRAAVSAWDRERPAASAVEHQRRPAASAVGHQRRLRRALLDQFPHPEDLTILLADSLDVHLDHVAGGGNQTEVCFNLVRWLWVDKVNRLRPLLDLAAEERPKSGELATLKRELSAD